MDVGMNFWRKILGQVSEIEALAEDSRWDEICVLSGALEESLHSFFDQVIHELDQDQQKKIKEEGERIIVVVTSIMNKAKYEKNIASAEAKKITSGSRGISAYKKT